MYCLSNSVLLQRVSYRCQFCIQPFLLSDSLECKLKAVNESLFLIIQSMTLIDLNNKYGATQSQLKILNLAILTEMFVTGN